MHGSSDDWNKLKHLVDLSAENARLKAEVEHWQEQWHFVIQDNNKQMDEIAALKAEVERLRASSFVTAVPVEQYERLIKAGDAMVDALNLDDDVFDNHEKKEAQAKWNAAKEGKQP